MKVLSWTLLVLVGLCYVYAEIIPRFPGNQPIIVNGVLPNSQYDVIETLSIDSFTFSTSPPVVVVSPEENQSLPVSSTSFDRDSSILGGERDIELTIQSGNPGLVLTAGASNGNFTVSTPLGATGVTTIQYDGLDSSPLLDSAVGLGNLDLTIGGATGFYLKAISDYPTQITVIVVDTNDHSASVGDHVAGNSVPTEILLDFDLFDNSELDFTQVTAIMLLIHSFQQDDLALERFSTYRLSVPVHCFSGRVLPCDMNYHRLMTFDDIVMGEYLYIEFNSTNEFGFPEVGSHFYVLPSEYEDLQHELASNENIRDTLGHLPGPKLYDWVCQDSCVMEIAANTLQNATYYFAIEGAGDETVDYTVCTAMREVPIFDIQSGIGLPVFKDHRPDYPPADRATRYRFYRVAIPEADFSPGTYLSVNISRVEPYPGLSLRVMYSALPESAFDAGILDEIDFTSSGRRSDEMVYPYCLNSTRVTAGGSFFEHPAGGQSEHIPCECTTQIEILGEGPTFQLTCGIVVDPCQFKYGDWFISVELPERDFPENPADLSGRTNYTLEAFIVQPAVYAIARNVTYHGYVSSEAATHYSIDVPASTVQQGETHFLVHISNLRNGFVNVNVHKGMGVTRNLAGREGCSGESEAFCRTSDACNLVVEKCHFSPGTWYISVEVSYDAEEDRFELFDDARLPMAYSIRANWMEDSTPVRLVAGVPVTRYIGEALYDFYVLNVPPVVDTWLFVELYTRAEDTELTLSILHGEIPGHDCYARPDFYCVTGDPHPFQWATEPSHYPEDSLVGRESCSFMIQTCELQAGPLFFSVYGHHQGYSAYGDTTYYQVPVHYTLWVDFDIALALQSGVSLSETVFEEQYQHYYIRADQSYWGSWISVEVTNIRHAQSQSIEAFVNYQYLAGDCPCYENLFNCTGSSACGAIPNEPVSDCCTIIVPASDFRPGVWYVSVLGISENPTEYTTPIGYTLTVTIHDPPGFYPLILGQFHSGQVPSWWRTHEYAHFRLGAAPLALNDLVLKLTFVQNCEFMGPHDDTLDGLVLYVNKHAPANELGYDYSCRADVFGESFCFIVIPHCEWDSDRVFVSVQGDFESDFPGRFTLRAYTDEVRDIALQSGVSLYNRVEYGLYKHFFIHVSGEEDEFLSIDLYTNSDQDKITAYVNSDHRAGNTPCFEHLYACETQTMCSWDIRACDLSPGRYYISVYGSAHQFYDISVEFTLTATLEPVSTVLNSGAPLTGHLWKAGDLEHYVLEVPANFPRGADILFKVENVKHGSVQVFSQYGHLAGRCPCLVSEQQSAIAGPLDPDSNPTRRDWAEIRIPTCRVRPGKFFFSVVAVENLTPSPPQFRSPIGFTVEATLQTQLVLTPVVDVGRDVAKTEIFQFISDHRYNHYEFLLDEDDLFNGYQLIVEITDVRDGSLYVYYNAGYPGDSSPGCHLAQICESGLSSGGECYWQLPFCTTRQAVQSGGDLQRHYITVEGITGQIEASYNILIYKEDVPSLNDNPRFTLDGALSSAQFGFGVELNSTHDKLHEPYGWSQFVRLLNVEHFEDEGRGEMLEIFFYRIENNPGENLDFDVYVYPKEPAGPHECCARNQLGSCQGAPCLNSVDVTTSVNGGPDVFSHTCEFGELGVGHDGAGPFFGHRCTVRVWPCEFEKYCSGIEDWFVTVVPKVATNPESNGVGLTYSMQWRTRNIRQLELGDNGSESLNEYLENPRWTRTYSVQSLTTESQGWRSFYVDWSSSHGRLSIQTNFFGGSGEVYIHGGEFASASPSCNDYQCSSDGDIDCAVGGRFIVTEGCSSARGIYYITVRNTGAPGSLLEFAFRIVSFEHPEIVDIPHHPTVDSPFVHSSVESSAPFPGVTGVQGENYNFFRMTLDDEDLADHKSWVVIVERDSDDTDTGALEVFIRYGAEAGNYGPTVAQSYYGAEPEAAHSYQYHCVLDSVGSQCVWEIPSCSLIRGHYFVSIWNPLFDFDEIPDDLPDYVLSTYVTRSTEKLSLNVAHQFTPNQNVLSNRFGLVQHYQLDLSASNLNANQREKLQNTYWTRYLRIQLDLPQTDQDSTLLVQYGDQPNSGCLNVDQTEFLQSCQGTCYVDILPCSLEQKLKSGSYFISVSPSSSQSSYTLTARMMNQDYQELNYQGHREAPTHRGRVLDEFWSHHVGNSELVSGGHDGDGNFFYSLDTIRDGNYGDIDGDDLDDLYYFYANISSPSMITPPNSLDLEIWRDDCTRWKCELSGSLSWCTVDAVGLSPCTAKSGRYYFKVHNPRLAEFTLSFHKNQSRIQTLEDRQILSDIIFPYEYQQYQFTGREVGQGATLNVRVCSSCGEVQAFLRPDLPAGPSGSGSEHCAIASCAVSGDPDSNEESCCEIFLDACEFQQRSYYIGVRGVSTTFPSENNALLVLPARYSVQATQTLVNFTESAPSCPTLIEYTEDWNTVPRQYSVDIETLQLGTQLRFSLRLSSEFPQSEQTQSTSLSFNLGNPAGFTEGCGNRGAYQCVIETDQRSCSFIVPYCALHLLSAGRFFVQTDAPRGSEILVERWEPSIPIIHADKEYHGTIQHDLNVEWDLPFSPSVQYYRFELDPGHDENYYDKFFARISVHNVRHGSVRAAVNSGYFPYTDEGTDCTWNTKPLFLDDFSCESIDEGETCYLEISYVDLLRGVALNEFTTRPPKTFWLTIWGLEQLCELHSIQYSFKVQTLWDLTYFPLGKSVCNSVAQNEYNFHRIQPHEVEDPQESILRVVISDLQHPATDHVRLLVQDNHLATLNNAHASIGSDGQPSIRYDHICGYDSLYVSVHGDLADEPEIDYRMSINKLRVPVKMLKNNSTYHADDDDGDACPHEHDFYIFRTAQPLGHHKGSFLRVAVDSEHPTRVFVNKNRFAWEGCHDSGYGENDPSITGTTTVNVYDFCDFSDGVYYITVVSEGPYYIFTHIRDDAIPLQLGHSTPGRSLQAGEYQMYTLEVCKDWYKPDDRLVISLSDVQNGDVTAWIRRDANPGLRTSSDPSSGDILSSSCSEFEPARATFTPGSTGYDYLLVDSYHLEPGTYYILVRSNGDLPRGGRSEDSRVCSRVSYRLFPYLEDLEVELLSLRPNHLIQDVVDYYTINRYEPNSLRFTNFYELVGIHTDRDGYQQQISQAVARLMHVRGGLLQMSIARDHLAVPRQGYISGESHALTREAASTTAFQSGRRPWMKQTLIDERDSPYSSCSDGSDYCCQTSRGDNSGLSEDSSCAVWLPSCYLLWTRYYVAVTALEQDSEDRPISYGLLVHQTRDFILIQPDTHRTGEFTGGDWDHHFYYSISAEPQSMRWRVVVTGGEGVLVTVRNHRCPLQADWERQVWCDAQSFDRPWLCDVEIQTRASHPGDTAYFVDVQGKNATYSIAFWRGRANCHAFTRKGRPEGLNFCAGLVPYATWRWDNYRTLDHQAECFFEQLYSHFAVQPCWSGVSAACNSSLQQFACHESFRGCDEQGFAVGTCRDSCESVVYECTNWFESVDLEHYNCTSHRYLDSRVESCTGGETFSEFDPENRLFLGEEPNLLRWKSSTSSASSLVFSFFVTILTLVLVL